MGEMLTGKGIVIVGGTSGIGLSAARAFVQEGASVLAMGLPVEETVPTDNDNLSFLFADATVEGSVEASIQACIERHGTFDALFHVAGGSGRKFGDGPLHEMSLEGWRRTLELNLDSVMLSNRAAIQHFLKEEKAGVILNTSTVLAYRPSPQFFYTHAYAAAKSAIIGFSNSIAAYYASSNIRVNVIASCVNSYAHGTACSQSRRYTGLYSNQTTLRWGTYGYPQRFGRCCCIFPLRCSQIYHWSGTRCGWGLVAE